MLMIYSPAGTEGMFAAMHALTQDQLMNAALTKEIALKHDTVMVEQSKDGRGKGATSGVTSPITFNPQNYQQRFFGLALPHVGDTLPRRSPIFGSAGHGWPP